MGKSVPELKNVTFIAHDVQLTTNDRRAAGDVDTLLRSSDIDFIVEMMRTVGEGIFDQTRSTKAAYLQQFGTNRKVQIVFYAEKLNEDIAERLLRENVHVFQDPVEARRCYD